MIRLRKKDDLKQLAAAWIREQLNLQSSMLDKIFDRLVYLDKKIEELKEEIWEIKRQFVRERKGIISLSERTKLAIKLILRKHGKLTPMQLSKLINLSRTRCNEYLKEMEREGIVKSEIQGRKKFYFLKS